MADNKSIWETRTGAWKREGKRDWDDPRLYLRQAGTVAGMLGDYIAYPIEAAASAVDDYVLQGAGKKGIEKGVNYLLKETEAGKAVVRLAKENPEIAKDLMDGANILGAIPVLRIASKAGIQGVRGALDKAGGVKKRAQAGVARATGSSSFPRMVTSEMNTVVQGGLFGDILDLGKAIKDKVVLNPNTGLREPQGRSVSDILSGKPKGVDAGFTYYGPKSQKIFSTTGEILQALPAGMLRAVSPKRLQAYEDTGIGRRAAFGEIAVGSPLTKRGAEALQRQMYLQGRVDAKDPPLMGRSSMLVRDQRLAEINDFNDPKSIEAVKKLVFPGVPDAIANRHIAHIKAAQGVDPLVRTILAVKPAKTDGIARELLGTATTGDPAIRKLTVGNLIPEYKKLVGMDQREKLSPTQMIEVLQVSVGLTKDVQKEMLTYIGSAGEMIGVGPKKMEKLMAKYPRSELIDEVIRARAKQQGQQQLTKRESRVLKAWNAAGKVATIKNKDGKVVSNKDMGLIPVLDPDDTLSFASSYLSKIKEMGGVNYVGTVDLKSNKAYLTVNDGSDLAGIGGGPKGSPDLIVTTPTQVVELGSRRTAGGKVKKRELKKGEKFDGPATPVKITPKVPQRFELGRTLKEKPMTKKEIDVEVKKIEDFTGLKKSKDETATEFQRRAIRHQHKNAKPGKRAKRQALKNQITLGTMAVQADTRDNPGLFSK